MPNRRRDLERARARERAAREVERRRARRRNLAIAGTAVLAVLVLFVIVSLGGDDDETDGSGTETTAGFEYGEGACPPAAPPSSPPRDFDDAPRRCIDDDIDYGAVVETSEGEFTIDLLEDDAPGTVNNFVVLARWGWFDGDDFHRVVPGFVIQGGDPFGEPPGTGDPGYAIPDELPASVSDYDRGAVAMANSGEDSGGSQFFVCSECGGLPGPNYALFGQVVEGIEVVEAINALGVGDGPPSKPVTISSIIITEKVKR